MLHNLSESSYAISRYISAHPWNILLGLKLEVKICEVCEPNMQDTFPRCCNCCSIQIATKLMHNITYIIRMEVKRRFFTSAEWDVALDPAALVNHLVP